MKVKRTNHSLEISEINGKDPEEREKVATEILDWLKQSEARSKGVNRIAALKRELT